MIWNFSQSSIWSNNNSPKNLSSIHKSMWDHHPIFYSGHIFSLWSNYILYFILIAEILPRHDPTYITSLHQIWAHLSLPISLNNFPKFLSREKHCKGSTTLACPSGIKFLQCFPMPKLPSSTKFQLNPFIHLSPASTFIFLSNVVLCKASAT
jgi:hypothetical protein